MMWRIVPKIVLGMLTTVFYKYCFAKKLLDDNSLFFATLGLHLGFSAKLNMRQVSACKMEPQSGFMIYLGPPTTHPPTHPPIPYPPTAKLFLFQCCAVSPPQLFPSSRKYVQCPPKCSSALDSEQNRESVNLQLAR